ncbi:MAG: ribonuclease J [Acidimicrobiia bacterium]|nr:ribonuclease J [Acidimicrobiia bacterium]
MALPVHITILGGLGDIGRNCAVLESDGRLVLLDCGQLFPDDLTPGVDSIYPDFAYLDDKLDRLEAAILTHGHEDHIGAVAHLQSRRSFPLFASAFTLGLVRNRLEEAGLLAATELNEVVDGETRRIGPFDVEFLPVTHSVPSGLISAITTPQGIILHSSDFKLDLTPLDGRVTDLARIGTLATEPGIRLLLCDSTNADQPGRTASETEVGPVLESVFRAHRGRRIITACFASHVHRVAQISAIAVAEGRRVATLGLSMKRNVALARDLGMLKIPDTSIVDVEEVERFEPGEVCVISTGSQAEDRSALALAAKGESRWIQIGADDTVILSSTAIPGNEAAVGRMMNNLVERGARVEHAGVLGLHTSGHGKADELRTLHATARPEWFVPVHGEHRHLIAHLELAESIGMSGDRTLLARDGDRIVIDDDGIRIDHGVTSGRHLYRHAQFVSYEHRPIGDRIVLGNGGLVSVVVVVDPDRLELAAEPEVTSRGWLADGDTAELHDELVEEVAGAVVAAFDDGIDDRPELERRVRRATGQFVNQRTRRRPMILTSVVEV